MWNYDLLELDDSLARSIKWTFCINPYDFHSILSNQQYRASFYHCKHIIGEESSSLLSVFIWLYILKMYKMYSQRRYDTDTSLKSPRLLNDTIRLLFIHVRMRKYNKSSFGARWSTLFTTFWGVLSNYFMFNAQQDKSIIKLLVLKTPFLSAYQWYLFSLQLDYFHIIDNSSVFEVVACSTITSLI